MMKVCMAKKNHYPEASAGLVMRLLGAGLLAGLASLIVVPSSGVSLFLEPAFAVVSALERLEAFGLSKMQTLMLVNGIAGGWAVLVGLSFLVSVLGAREVVLQLALYTFLVLALGMWVATIWVLYQLPFVGVPLAPGAWSMVVPGVIAALLGIAGLIFFTGVHCLGDDTTSDVERA